MPVNIIDTLKPKNGLSFPIVEAIDVFVDGFDNLADAVSHFATDVMIEAINIVLSGKANTADVNSAVANLQGQIDQIVISASAEAVVAPEVAAARVAENGTTYDTLKERIDAADIANISEVSIGKNIFFSEWTANGYSINQNTGADESESGYQRTGYIEVEGSTTYTASTDFGYAPTVYIFCYDSAKNFISVISTAYGFYPKTFTTPQNTKYIRFKETYQAMPTHFQLEKGSTATSYEAPYKDIKIPYDNLIDTPDLTKYDEMYELTEEVTGKNIFFSEWTGNGYSINQDTGADEAQNGYQRTGYIEVEESTTYTASTNFGYAPTVFIFCYDSTKAFISALSTTYGFYPKTFTTPQNTKYIRFKQTYEAMPTNFQIEKGSTATSYEAPYKELAIPAEHVYGIPQELPDGGLAGQLLMKTSEGCEWATTTTGNGILYEDKKFLFLGDSITAETGNKSWVDKFKVLVSANTYSYNQAVGGASWCDSESGLIYDGEPYNDMNFIGNQVAWCQRIGFSSSAFDYIIISAGTNDTNTSYPTDADVETEMYVNNTIKALADVDRSTWQGAIRWSVQTLRSMYPNAKIILVSPIQRRVAADGTTLADMYPTIKAKRDTIEKLAKRMGTYYIDTADCDITNFDSSDYADGLHPSAAGAQKLAEFIFRKIVPIICDYA